MAVCDQSGTSAERKAAARSGQHFNRRLRDSKGDQEMGTAWDNESGHGQRVRGWQSAMAVGTLRPRGICYRYSRWSSDQAHSGRSGAAWIVCISPAGTLLVGAYRQYALTVLRDALEKCTHC